MPTETYFVFDGKNCKHEGMTKEQIYNAIAEATGNTPQDIDEGFISTIVETNKSRSLHIWRGTQSEFNALQSIDPDTFYIITDDTTVSDLEAAVDNMQESIESNAEAILALQQKTADTDWISITRIRTNSQEEEIGKYRVKNKIAYFDFSYNPTHFNSSSNDSFVLPIKLSVSGIAQAIPFIASLGAGNVSNVYGTLSNSNDQTTLTVTNGGGNNASSVKGSFCYPVD